MEDSTTTHQLHFLGKLYMVILAIQFSSTSRKLFIWSHIKGMLGKLCKVLESIKVYLYEGVTSWSRLSSQHLGLRLVVFPQDHSYINDMLENILGKFFCDCLLYLRGV